MIEGIIIFSIVLIVFLFLYFKKGLYEALIITSIIATLGLLFIPDVILFSFYLRILGHWRLVVISMNDVKLIIIVSMVLFTLYLRGNKHKFEGVIS